MKKFFILFSVTIFAVSDMNADILEIPEVKVYGERKVEVEPVKKQPLPFEKEYIEPSIINTVKGLPKFEVEKKQIIERDIGFRAKAEAGNYLGGYFLGYGRGNFYPLEVGTDFVKSSNPESSAIQIFSRTSVESFYVNGAFYGIESFDPIYRFNIGNTHKFIDFDFFGVYIDSLIGVADINLKYSPFKLNLQLGKPVDYSIKVLYEKYPLQAGAVWFDARIYPELVYFLPVYDLYIKSSLLNKTGITYLYCQSLQYLREYSSTDTYYRVELGQSAPDLPVSLIYSHYLNGSRDFIGAKVTYRELFFELEFPFESDDDYVLRTGLSARFSEIISADIYGYSNGTENYFIGVDLGYEVMSNLKIGINIESNHMYGVSSEDNLDIGGYIFFTF